MPLQACVHRVPVDKAERGSQWPEAWPHRLQRPPYWLNSSQMGIYGRPAPQDFTRDYKHWRYVVSTSYMSGLGINWSNVRNVMDMRAVYGGYFTFFFPFSLFFLFVHPFKRDVSSASYLQICGSFEGPASLGYECSECKFSRYASHNI